MQLRFASGLAGCLLSTVLTAAVLPEDRADVLYHRYEGGGMTIDGPSVLVRKSVGGRVSVSANQYVDSVSAASVDVLASASPYTEERTEKSLGVDYLAGKAIYSLSVTGSEENDYEARTVSFGASQDFFGDLTTLSLGYARGDDTVHRRGDALFEEQAERQHFRFGVTQVITRNMIMALGHEFVSDEGFLNNPYRSVRYRTATGYASQPEVYPNTRSSEATALRAGYYLPWRAALHAEYRWFSDSWGINSRDWRIAYVFPFRTHWEFEVNYRNYDQSGADFYSDLFPYQDAQTFLARDKEMSDFTSTSWGVAASWEFLKGRYRLIDRVGLRLAADRYSFDYQNFRDITVKGLPAGTEPLYSFDATVSQVLLSVWY